MMGTLRASSKANSADVDSFDLILFHCVLKAPGSPSNYLAAIDDAMEVRLKGGSVKAAGR